MMDLETIREIQAEETARAARLNKAPVVLFSVDTAVDDVRRAPWLGEYVHPNWRLADYGDFRDAIGLSDYAAFDREPGIWLFIDKSGMGDRSEPALNGEELDELLPRLVERAEELDETIGVGIVEEGQFQIHIALYVRSVGYGVN